MLQSYPAFQRKTVQTEAPLVVGSSVICSEIRKISEEREHFLNSVSNLFEEPFYIQLVIHNVICYFIYYYLIS